MANVLGELFQGIADAIRSKTGGTDKLVPNNFPTEISAIETGGDTEEIDDLLDTINGEIIGETQYTVTFIGADGEELGQMSVYEENDCADPIDTGVFAEPTMASTKYYAYPFAGWALSEGGEADESALLCITGNRTVYAVFNEEKIYLATGYCGSGSYVTAVAWGIDPDYVLEIYQVSSDEDWTGNYFSGSNDGSVPPWYAYRTLITKVVIGEGIRNIGMHNFEGCTALTSVVLPATMRMITHYAFCGCTSLTTIDIPAAVKFIQEFAFKNAGLTSANFERTTDWTIYSDGNQTTVLQTPTSDELSDPATAANLLVTVDNYWFNSAAA